MRLERFKHFLPLEVAAGFGKEALQLNAQQPPQTILAGFRNGGR